MKKIYSIIAIFMVGALSLVASVNLKKQYSELFVANVEALTGAESGFAAKDPCAGKTGLCRIVCPRCGVPSEVDQLGPANLQNVYGKCVECGYEIPRK